MNEDEIVTLMVLVWLAVVSISKHWSEVRKARWKAEVCIKHRNEIDPDIAARRIPQQRATRDDIR